MNLLTRNNVKGLMKSFSMYLLIRAKFFFVDDPGGTGKMFLYKALLSRVRSEGLIAIATATSGIAASILPRGCTAHSRFKIPIKIGDNSMCSFMKQSGTA